MEEMLIEYYLIFDELPPLPSMLTYNHPVYSKMIRVAIDTNNKITLESLEKQLEIDNVEYDLGKE